MKKYIIGGLLLCSLLMPAISSAQTTDPNTSTSVAMACVSINNNLRYGARDSATSGEVTILQNFLRSKNYLSVAATGYFGPLTLKGVKDFQRASSITPIAGFVGPITRAKIKSLTCISSNSSVVISGVSGPQNLNINQTGTWTVTASSTTGGNLSYSVYWGDEPLFPAASPQQVSATGQSATFTHSYTRAGTYGPTFTVTSANTINCITVPCTSNAGSAQTNLTVNVSGTATSSGSLSINPNNAIIKTNTTTTFQAMYQPPEPACHFSEPACMIMTPAPYAVRATWTSSNTGVATVMYKDNCPTGAQCLVYQPDYLTAAVTGVSEGSTVLTAKYTDASGNVLTATIPVTVQYLIR